MIRKVRIHCINADHECLADILDENYRSLYKDSLHSSELYDAISKTNHKNANYFGDALEEVWKENTTIDYIDAVNLNQWDMLWPDFFEYTELGLGIKELFDYSNPTFTVAYKHYSKDTLEVGLFINSEWCSAWDKHNMINTRDKK